ncbi:hypothetical protein [Orrella marina]|uniref:hypothetical protein n=1 Tax=Orrella marina TaxID=2163011 RepID=UPI001D131354|nr:hypothetical protein [Orrella marina]
MGAGAIGYLFGPLGWISRLIAIGAAALLVLAAPLTDEVGLVLCIGFILLHAWQVRRKSRSAPTASA